MYVHPKNHVSPLLKNRFSQINELISEEGSINLNKIEDQTPDEQMD